MQEHEYKARDKTVKKMGRDGLVEENLHSKEQTRVSNKEKDVVLSARIDESDVDMRQVRSHSDRDLEFTGKERKGHFKNKEQSGKYDSVFDSLANTRKRIRKQQNSSTEKTDSLDEDELIEENTLMQGESGAGKARSFIHSNRMKALRSQARESAETSADDVNEKAHEAFKENVKKKQSRLLFDDEESGMASGVGGISKKAGKSTKGKKSSKDVSDLAVSGIKKATWIAGHALMQEGMDDNAGLDSAHLAEAGAELATKKGLRSVRKNQQIRQYRNHRNEERNSKLHFSADDMEEVDGNGVKKSVLKKQMQKKRYQREYQAARRSAEKGADTAAKTIKATQSAFQTIKAKVKAAIIQNKSIFGIVGLLAVLILVILASFSSCGAALQGTGSTVVSTTYASTDEEIYAVENAYVALEQALDEQINNMESTHQDYDEYRYQIDEISHNPYQLISYFTAKYGEFTYEQVADEVEEIFRQQYRLSTDSTRDTVTETRTVRVGESLGQVVTSGYCNCSICCGRWSGGPTASGVYPTASHTIAVDASNPFVPMGTVVVMNGVEYVVEDTGAFDQFGVQFDVYYGDHATASAHGHQTWEAYIADSNGSQEVEVTSTQEVNRFEVSLTNHSLDAILRSRLDENGEKRYDVYNATYGNRNYLFDVNTLPGNGGGAGGFGYEIPAEALTDEKFANMIHEAEKYLGYPYVWGGASPSTSFDCSGFVCWVINNCGNGWNVGRDTADGLRSYCSYVSPDQAKPGDLIFFQKTYDTPGASHIGIYVGDGMMIHCGKPIQYASINTSYWQEHFLAFGRLH